MNPADIDFMSMPAGLNRGSYVNYSADGYHLFGVILNLRGYPDFKFSLY